MRLAALRSSSDHAWALPAMHAIEYVPFRPTDSQRKFVGATGMMIVRGQRSNGGVGGDSQRAEKLRADGASWVFPLSCSVLLSC